MIAKPGNKTGPHLRDLTHIPLSQFLKQNISLIPTGDLPNSLFIPLIIISFAKDWQFISPRPILFGTDHWVTFGFNSLAPGKFEWNFRYLIFQIISVTDGWVISSELALGWMSLNLTDDKSTLVQVMAWCRQATSHYLSQFWPRSLSPYGVTRSQWVQNFCPVAWCK